jgi:uncharacterized protein YdaT
MPWTVEDPPAVALNWTEEERRRCVEAANAVLEETGDEEQAIFACIRAAGKGRTTMEKKTYRGRLQFKADADKTGEFAAEFATLGVIDHDQDVTEAGAFQDGQETMIEAWNHNYGQLPVGKGVIHERDDKAVIEGAFFMDTQGGQEHYKVVKALADLGEWSYTFEILDSGGGKFEDQDVRFLRKLDVWGIAPVQRGAGIDTRTVDIKTHSAKSALASHSTATTDAAWDGPANEARARSGEAVAYYRRIYAWADPEGDPAVKSTYRFIHHMVAEDGTPGAANIRGCQTAIGVLNGGRGGTTIPDADRQGVWSHVARHLRDADLEPPELKAAKSGARHTAKEYETLQSIHDMVVELGATCPGHDDTGGDGGDGDGDQGEAGDGKSRVGPTSTRASAGTLAARVAMELLEAGY